jgi:hypothetical protein
MALADDLLLVADDLRKKSREADLRRSASSAYYSAFHRLVDDSLALVLSNAVPLFLYVRSIQHSEMMKCAQAFEKPTDLSKFGFSGQASPDLKLVAENTRKLYGWRIDADYDSAKGFGLTQANDAFDAALDLHEAAGRLRSSADLGYVCMLAAMLLRKPIQT